MEFPHQRTASRYVKFLSIAPALHVVFSAIGYETIINCVVGLISGFALCAIAILFANNKGTSMRVSLLAYIGAPFLLVSIISAIWAYESGISLHTLLGGVSLQPYSVAFVLLFAATMYISYFAPASAIRTSLWVAAGGLVSMIVVVAMLSLIGNDDVAPERLSLEASMRITGAMYLDSARAMLVGAGPNTIDSTIEKFHPVQLNNIENREPAHRMFSTMLAYSVTIGFLGFISILLCPIALVIAWLFRTRADNFNTIVSAVAVFGYLAAFVYPLSAPALLYIASLTGFALGYLDRTHDTAEKHSPIGHVLRAGILGLIGTVVIITSILQLTARVYFIRASNATSQERAVLLDRASTIWSESIYIHAASAAFFSIAQAKYANDDKEIESDLKHAVRLADKGYDSHSFDPMFVGYRASMYIGLMQISYPNAEEKARSSLEHLMHIAPTRAETYYLQALYAVRTKDAALALQYVTRALLLNPAYREAQQLRDALMKNAGASSVDKGSQ